MTPEDIQFLNDNRGHHDTLVNAGYLRGFSGEIRSRMQEIIGKYWQPGYHTDLWCPPCVSEMLKKLYRHYDEWLAQQPIGGPAIQDQANEIMEQLNREFDELLTQWPLSKDDETTGT